MTELDDLYVKLWCLEDQRDSFYVHGDRLPGDKEYQDILRQIEYVKYEIDNYENVDD